MSQFKNKRIVITGGTSGIGKAGALKIVEEGGIVFVTGRNFERIQQLKKELPEHCCVYYNDALEENSVQTLFKAVKKWSNQIDGLWLNAGIAHLDQLDSSDGENFQEMIKTNLFIPRMQLSTLSSLIKEGGSVVLTSSSSVYEGANATGDYAAVKGGLVAGARSWAAALAERNIRVNTIVPGAIETNFRSFLSEQEKEVFEANVLKQVPLKRIGKPEEVASVASFLLSDASSYMTGSQLFVDGGLLRN